jgi:N utilization substance protein A
MHVLRLVSQMANERKLSKEFILELIKDTLTAVAQNDFGEESVVDVVASDTTGTVEAFLVKKVVRTVTKPAIQVSVKEAKEFDKTLKINDEMRIAFPFDKLSRNCIALAKNMLVQRIRDKEKERVQEKYLARITQIETGTVQKIARHELIVKLKDAEGIIPPKEQIPDEKYYQGNTIKAYVLNVTPGGRVLLSRSHPDFLKKLFEQEVPEIREKIVEIRLAARIPGIRSKIAVSSNNSRVDPVGACVGVKGSRIQAVVKELNNEKIDVIQYTSESIVMIGRALSGVKILHQDLDIKEGKIYIVVPDEDLPKAIGKNGENVSLASRITNLKIDIASETEHKSQDIALIPKISESIKKSMIEHGFLTTVDVMNKGVDALIEVPGIGEKTAQRILGIVEKLMQ